MTSQLSWPEGGIPTLETNRLVLRPFLMGDAKDVQRLAGDPRVAATTAAIPHPYPDGAAEEWIGLHAEWFQKKEAVPFAITLKPTGQLIGCIDLSLAKPKHARAEMGYWVGAEFWNQGYCTEAAIAVVDFGLNMLNLNKIAARHLGNNPSSGKVMIKAGLEKEGHLRREFSKNGEFQDVEIYGILRNKEKSR